MEPSWLTATTLDPLAEHATEVQVCVGAEVVVQYWAETGEAATRSGSRRRTKQDGLEFIH